MSEARKAEMFDAVDNLQHVHDRWETDPNAVLFPAEQFRIAIEDLAHACNPEEGDVPSECFELCVATIDLLGQWEEYYLGEKHTRSGEPTSAFWEAYRHLLKSREGAKPVIAKRIESPKLLREQKVPDWQIAKIWGAREENSERWFGPFYDERGNVLSDLIQQEVDKPGSVLGENPISPAEKVRIERGRKSVERRMEAVKARVQSRQKQRMDEYEVASLLKEGQFFKQIVKVSLWSDEEVLDLARRLNIRPANAPDLKSGEIEQPAEPTVETSDSDTDELIRMSHDEHPEWDAGQIASELGVTVSKVAAVLREKPEPVS